MNNKIEPCPFCGQCDALVEQLDADASVVICQGLVGGHSACLARGPVGVQDRDSEDQPGRDAAIREWNRRAAPVVERQDETILQYRVVRHDPRDNKYSDWFEIQTNEKLEQVNTDLRFTASRGEPANYEFRRLYTFPPELAELQASFKSVGDAYDAEREENSKLRAEIERLKGGQGEPVAWSYCPECGCEGLHHEQGEHKQCANCYQEWFSDIDYSEVVRGNLAKLKASQPAPVSVEHSCGLDTKSKCSACLDKVKELNL